MNTNKKNITVIAVSAFLVAAILSPLYPLLSLAFRSNSPNRTIVRNSASVPLRRVLLVVQRYDGTEFLSRNVDSLAPGDSMVLHHSLGNVSVRLTFRMGEAAKEYEYTEDYVDLWTSEGWLMDVQPDGEIRVGYDYPMED